MSDTALFAQACRGDEKAARRLVQQLSPQAYAVAWRMLGDAAQAQDMVQEGFIKLFSTQQYAGASRLSTYFYTVVTRLCLERLRAQRATPLDWVDGEEESANNAPDDSGNPLAHLQNAEAASMAQKAIMTLPPRQRAALTLWAYQDASAAHIAHTLEIDVNAAHQLLHRAKTQMRAKLKEWGYAAR